jgi:hypothetical protein
MPYVKRDENGRIVAFSQIALEGFEPLHTDLDEAEVMQMLDGVEQNRKALERTDLEFVRVVEDLVMVLVDKNMIRFTDLPEVAQRKMLERQRMRDGLRPHLDLIPEDDSDGLI